MSVTGNCWNSEGLNKCRCCFNKSGIKASIMGMGKIEWREKGHEKEIIISEATLLNSQVEMGSDGVCKNLASDHSIGSLSIMKGHKWEGKQTVPDRHLSSLAEM